MKKECKIIEDLMPLYIDEVCSDESIELVKNHLTTCSDCRIKYESQTSNITLSKKMIDENLKAKQPFKKIKRRNLFILATAGILIGSLCGIAISYITGATKLLPPFIGAFAGTILSLLSFRLLRKK